MSEEEKAIETLKEVASDDFDTLGDDISPKMAQNILNVIERQEEEITKLSEKVTNNICANVENEVLEEYRQTIKKQQKEIEKYEQQIDLEFVEKNFIEKNKVVSKDKIREKIKELEEKSDYWNCDEIQVLQELLEENNNE